MSKNFRMIIKNEFDDCEVTPAIGTTVETTLPIINMQKYSNSRVARFTTPDETKINGNFVSLKNINSFVIWRNNLSTQATIRLVLFASDNQTGAVVYDSGTVQAIESKALNELDWGIDELGASSYSGFKPVNSVLWFDPVVVKSFQLTIIDEALDFIDIARIYCGLYFETAINMAYGASSGWIDNTINTRTAGASLWSDVSKKFRFVKFDLKNLTEGERGKAMQSFNIASKSTDFFISCYPESGGIKERDHSFAGKFVNSPNFTTEFFNNYTAPFEIEEA